MALNFSEGLFSGLWHYGQKQQPRQQRGAGGGMLTPAQQFNPGEMVARSLGKVAGVDMRTPMEVLQEQFKTIPQEFPASAQSKLYDAVAGSSAVTPKARLEALTLKKALEKAQREKGEEILKQQGLEDIFNIYMSVDPESWQDQALVVTPVNNIVKEHNLDPKEAQAVFESAKEIRSVKDPGVTKPGELTSFGPGAQIIEDKDGDKFYVSWFRDEGPPPSVSQIYTPIGDHGKIEPSGKIDQVGAYGETGAERAARDIERIETEKAAGVSAEEQTAWNERKRTIKVDGVSAGMVVYKLQNIKELAQQIQTGGYASLTESFKRFVGVTGATEGEFINQAGQLVMDELGKLAGAISDGERAFVQTYVAGFGQSRDANVAILDRAIKDATILFERAKWLLEQPETLTEDQYYRKEVADLTRMQRQPKIIRPGSI